MLARFLRRIGVLKRRTDFYGLATESRGLPDAEVEVASAALEGSGPLGQRFVRQLREAPAAWRLIGRTGSYEARVSMRGGLVRGVPRGGWTSDAIPVRTTEGRDLEMRLHVVEIGAMELLGDALDDRPWPRSWTVDPQSLAMIRFRAPWLALPTEREVRQQRSHAVATIERWLGEPGALRGKRGVVSADPPATEDELRAFEVAQGFTLPAAYRDLVFLANGIEIGSTIVLGLADAYRLDIPGPDRLLISPPDEIGAVVLAPDGAVYFVDIEAASSSGRLRASDLRAWVLKARGRPGYQT